MTKHPVKFIPLPKETKAFICANCGAVALSPGGVCKVQGQATRGHWCGSKSFVKPAFCVNGKHNHRFACAKCGKVALNPELLCEPEALPEP